LTFNITELILHYMKKATQRALARWMDANGWTQMRLAAYLDRSTGWMSQVFSGESVIGLEIGLRLSELTEIPLEDLVTDKSAQRILEDYVNRLLVKRGIAKDNASVA
jgi:transcriptional regulator with XRE-family HTH domain